MCGVFSGIHYTTFKCTPTLNKGPISWLKQHVYSLFLVYTHIYSIDRAHYPEKLNQFVETTESVSTSGNKSKGEDMDACLEEVNKESKVWQHGRMVALHWLRIFRNLGNLSKVCLPFFTCIYIYVC